MTETSTISQEQTMNSAVTAATYPELTSGPKHLPIVGRHDIYLFWVAGDGKRFAGLFRNVWNKLPLWTKRKLLKRWRDRRPNLEVLGVETHWPFIELVADKSDFSRGNSGDAMAQTRPSAAAFAFNASSMDALPDTAVEAVIAHELAHAIYFIACPDEHAEGSEYDQWGFSQAEYDADELAECWGFDIELLNTLTAQGAACELKDGTRG